MVPSSPGGRGRAGLRSIFLSDVHLGSPRAQAELLLDFLACHRAEQLYLVGDVADDTRRLARARHARLAARAKACWKRGLGHTARFERSALGAARARRVDGIRCEHAHASASRTVDGLYCGDDGDWVGSATALVEHGDGRLELVRCGAAA